MSWPLWQYLWGRAGTQLPFPCPPLKVCHPPGSGSRNHRNRGGNEGQHKHTQRFTTSLHPSFAATPLSPGPNDHCFSLCQRGSPAMWKRNRTKEVCVCLKQSNSDLYRLGLFQVEAVQWIDLLLTAPFRILDLEKGFWWHKVALRYLFRPNVLCFFFKKGLEEKLFYVPISFVNQTLKIPWGCGFRNSSEVLGNTHW